MIVQRLTRRRQPQADAQRIPATPHAGGWLYKDAGSPILVWRSDRLPHGVVAVEPAPRQRVAETPRVKPIPALENQIRGMFRGGWKPTAL